jgi:hypothetical protein
MQLTVQDLKDKGLLLFEAISGSRAYGTNKETSDTDWVSLGEKDRKGVVLSKG